VKLEHSRRRYIIEVFAAASGNVNATPDAPVDASESFLFRRVLGLRFLRGSFFGSRLRLGDGLRLSLLGFSWLLGSSLFGCGFDSCL
jgi:hypothetical protein